MFNEAFWLVYLANLGSTLTGMAFVCGFIAIGILGPWGGALGDIHAPQSDWKIWRRTAYTLTAFVAMLGITAALWPPKEAFYAGAAQSVAQYAQVDDTLLSLKKLIDKKIDEQLDKKNDK